MTKKSIHLVLLAALAGVFSFITISQAEPDASTAPVWGTDFEAAKALARAENKPILVDFTGSDWCIWCIKLRNEVFSKPVFQEYALNSLILLKVDFPRKTEQSPELKAHNQALAEKYGIRGFPTILILDGDGQVIERTGYRKGGVDKYVEHLQEIIARGVKS